MDKMREKEVLVTGAAGFIGRRTAELLLRQGRKVVGIDNMNDYYDPRLKHHRVEQLGALPGFTFYPVDIENLSALDTLFVEHDIGGVINLAARAGVRYSIRNPHVYMSTNAAGTLNLLETMRAHNVKKFVLASTSSLYAGQPMPFTEELPVNSPISPYAASKKAAEMMAYTYHHLFGIDVTILRYFTVYGPAGRPDMSVFRFIRWIDEGGELTLYGDGSQRRDFTYVDDIAEGTIRALKPLGFEIINLGNSHPHSMNELIRLIEEGLGKKARIARLPVHPTDMDATWADIGKAERLLTWKPEVPLDEGVRRTVAWYLDNLDWVSEIEIDLSR
jgi:nucleoside-diphosphate-sugar epimerase